MSYRDGCNRCAELLHELARANAEIEAMKAQEEKPVVASTSNAFPFQGGNKGEHKCVVCKERLFKEPYPHGNPGYWESLLAQRHDLKNKRDHVYCTREEKTTVSATKFLFWTRNTSKLTENKGCPPVPHLHRFCWSCEAEWVERTAQ